jgi:hypothetical protein
MFNSFDAVFTGAATAASLALYYKFYADTRAKRPLPIHFDINGVGDNTIKNANLGGAIYPVLCLAISATPLIRAVRHQMSESRQRALIAIEQENAAGTNPLGRFGASLRVNVMPYLNTTTIIRGTVLFVLALQHYAQQISLGEAERVPAGLVRGILVAISSTYLSHWALGTLSLM